MSAVGSDFSDTGLWQIVESEGYRVDLDIWGGLASRSQGEVLDLGCGIGRVSHYLNRLGHRTTGVDLDPELIEDFNRTRPVGAPEALVADVTALPDEGRPLAGTRFGLVIAPQQLLQIIGGREARSRLLAALPDLMEPGGTVALAICEELPDWPVDYPDVPPDLRELDGWVHSSQPVSIETDPDSVTAFRERKSLSPAGEVFTALNAVTLDRIDRRQLEEELLESGFTPCGSSPIPATDRHMASTLVLARVANS